MELEVAKNIANQLMTELSPVTTKMEVVGSIRRQCPTVKDIDLLVIPKALSLLDAKLRELGCNFGGPKIRRLVYKGALVDIYIATPETWATLLLIRTGSTRHNVFLCKLARARGWQLKADGQGLLDARGNRIAGDSEETIFEALVLPFKPPEERE
jgi:DNA polymerase (family 10)